VQACAYAAVRSTRGVHACGQPLHVCVYGVGAMEGGYEFEVWD